MEQAVQREPRVMAIKAKRRETKVKKAKAKAKPVTPTPVNPRPEHYHFWRTDTNFNILPKQIFNPIIASHLTQFPRTLTQRMYYIESEFPLRDPTPQIKAYTEIDWTQWSHAKSVAIRAAVRTVVKYRALFRKLLHHMRVKKLSPANTEDIVTMEIPKKPILVVDWTLRQKYTFEAQTLMKDISCRLLTNDGLFQDAQLPRNPFTNLPFTQAQQISVWNSISSAGIAVSSVFTLFRKARYNLDVFELENTHYLKLNALKRTMTDPSCYYYRERMIDFIAFSYEQEDQDCDKTLYTYCMRHHPNHSILKEWASACYLYYAAEILYMNMPTQLNRKKEQILELTRYLIDNQYKLTYLWENAD